MERFDSAGKEEEAPIRFPQRSQSFHTSTIRRKRLDSHDRSLGPLLPRHPSHESKPRIVPKSRSFDRSSVNSSSRTSRVSKTSSILTPRFMPWAFSNISARLIPSDVEEDRVSSGISYSHSNRDTSKHSTSDHDYTDAVVNSSVPVANANVMNGMKNQGINSNHVATKDVLLGRNRVFQFKQGTMQDMTDGNNPIFRNGRLESPGFLISNSVHSLKYSSHHQDEKDYDEDLSTDLGDSNHEHDSIHSLHQERYRNYPLGPIQSQYPTVNISSRNTQYPTKTPATHERSRSVDFADYLEESGEHKFPSLLRSFSEVFKSPPRYGATTFAPYTDDNDSMVFSPLVERSRDVHPQSGKTFPSPVLDSSDHDSLEHLDPPRSPRKKRSMRRRIYVLLTDPQSSILSALCTAIIFFMIICSNFVMVLQTLDRFEYKPSSCHFCDEYYEHMHTDDVVVNRFLTRMTKCECPPRPIAPIANAEYFIMCFFAVEWLARFICFEPLQKDGDPPRNLFKSMADFYLEPHSVMDLLAFLPYFVEKYAANYFQENYAASHNFLSFRLMRIFRVFQLIRLGQYNITFCTLVNVLISSLPSINMLSIALMFGGVFFGTVVYWLERGEWKYTDLLDPPGFAHVRIGKDGLMEELSPFRSIPGCFWWFIVTVTTVGYGDMVPTSPLGKIVGSCAMLVGVLVIAFPVSVFSELWSKELKANGAYRSITENSTRDDFDDMDDDSIGKERAPPKVISAIVDTSGMKDDHSASKESASFHSLVLKPEVEPFRFDDGHLDVASIQAIRHYMSVIDDAQQKIQSLLEKIEVSNTVQ